MDRRTKNAVAKRLMNLASMLAEAEAGSQGSTRQATEKHRKAVDITDMEASQQQVALDIMAATKRAQRVKDSVGKASTMLQAEINKLAAKAKSLDDALVPVIDAAQAQMQRAETLINDFDPETGDEVAFGAALERVRGEINAVMQECDEACAKIASYLDIQITASQGGRRRRKVAGVISFVKDVFSSLIGWIGSLQSSASKLETVVDELEAVVRLES